MRRRTGSSENSDRARAPFQGVSVTDPVDGTWRLRVFNRGTAPVTLPLAGWVSGGSLTLDMGATPAENGTVSVTATVQDGGAPTEAVVTATVVDSTGEKSTVDLVDDGAHGDGEPGDGTFGGTSGVVPDGDTAVTVRATTPGRDACARERRTGRARRPEPEEADPHLDPGRHRHRDAAAADVRLRQQGRALGDAPPGRARPGLGRRRRREARG